MSRRKKLRLDSGQIEVADEAMVEVLRQKAPAERLAIGFAIWTSSRSMLKAYLKDSHPNWNSKRIKEEVLRRFTRGAL